MDICDLAPGYIRAIAPYQPGKPISELAREMGIDEARIIKLASNENPRGVSPLARRAIEAALSELARYPDGNGFELKQALARRYGIAQERIVLGNGSNDVLEMAARAFLAPGLAAVYSQHAFAVYPLAVQAAGAAPFAQSFAEGFARRYTVRAETVATAIRIGDPASYARAVRAIRDTDGVVLAVDDDAILAAKAAVDAKKKADDAKKAGDLLGRAQDRAAANYRKNKGIKK